MRDRCTYMYITYGYICAFTIHRFLCFFPFESSCVYVLQGQLNIYIYIHMYVYIYVVWAKARRSGVPHRIYDVRPNHTLKYERGGAELLYSEIRGYRFIGVKGIFSHSKVNMQILSHKPFKTQGGIQIPETIRVYIHLNKYNSPAGGGGEGKDSIEDEQLWKDNWAGSARTCEDLRVNICEYIHICMYTGWSSRSKEDFSGQVLIV